AGLLGDLKDHREGTPSACPPETDPQVLSIARGLVGMAGCLAAFETTPRLALEELVETSSVELTQLR
ncbi:hypothetical protein, partial [Streptomyces fagopyri]|uniref:hypothetical protein n=1 Tax=Streptomyces fagopyri TaxID=2662397 RepID=UPI0033E910D2